MFLLMNLFIPYTRCGWMGGGRRGGACSVTPPSTALLTYFPAPINFINLWKYLCSAMRDIRWKTSYL